MSTYKRNARTGPNEFQEYGPWERKSHSSSSGRNQPNNCSNAVCVTCLGFVLIIASIFIQFWTESNYISRLHDINHIDQTVVNLNDYNLFKSISPSDPVYISNKLRLGKHSQYPFDSQSGVKHDCFIMHKDIEMYSWIEHKSQKKETSPNGEETRTVTTYKYTKEWTNRYLDSAHFKHASEHHNPQINAFISAQNSDSYFYATHIQLGKYEISKSIQHYLKNGVLFNDISQSVYDKFYKSKSQWNMKHGYVYSEYNSNGNNKNTQEPNVGDVRIKWSAVDLGGFKATFLGSKSASNELTKYYSANGDEYVWFKVGREDSAKDIIGEFHADNAGKLWMYRGLTLLLMCIGFLCTSQLVNYIVSYIPICGNLIGCALNMMAILVAFIFWFLFFLIAYLCARKEVAIALIAIIIIGLLAMQKSIDVHSGELLERLRHFIIDLLICSIV